MPLRLFVSRVDVQLPSLHGLWELNAVTNLEKLADVEDQS